MKLSLAANSPVDVIDEVCQVCQDLYDKKECKCCCNYYNWPKEQTSINVEPLLFEAFAFGC